LRKLQTILFLFLGTALLLPACSALMPNCIRGEVFCVGLVTEVGGLSENPLNQSAWEGIQRAEQELGARVELIETTDAGDYARNIAQFGDAHYDVIVTVSSALGDATVIATREYPDVDFIGVDQFQVDEVEGIAGLNFPEDQAGFLVGALASMMSESHKIGAVCATDMTPAYWRYGEGYKAGAVYGDQLTGVMTEVIVVYHSDVGLDQAFTDPHWGAATAQTMMDQGADLIFGCGGLTGDSAITTTAEAGTYVIGVDTDQYLTLPEAAPRMLSSAVKLINPGVFDLIKLSSNGVFPSGNYFGHVAYAPYHDLDGRVPRPVKAMMEQIHAGLLDGSIQTNVPPAPE